MRKVLRHEELAAGAGFLPKAVVTRLECSLKQSYNKLKKPPIGGFFNLPFAHFPFPITFQKMAVLLRDARIIVRASQTIPFSLPHKA